MNAQIKDTNILCDYLVSKVATIYIPTNILWFTCDSN
jgi:hypothetical protein